GRARAPGSGSDCDAGNLRFALSAKCAVTRAERAAFCSACPMSSILLEVNLELDATRRIGMGREAADARAQRLAAVQAPCERRIFAPRHVAQLAAVPRDAHGAGIMRIVGLATQLEGVAHPQLIPYFRGGVIPETRQRRALHQQAHARRALVGAAVVAALAHADFGKHQRAALLGDEIDLSQPAAPVSLDQPQACCPQQACTEVFGSRPGPVHGRLNETARAPVDRMIPGSLY